MNGKRRERIVKFQGWYDAWPAHVVQYDDDSSDYVEQWSFSEEKKEKEAEEKQNDNISRIFHKPSSSSSSHFEDNLLAPVPFNKIIFMYPRESDSVPFSGKDQYMALTEGQWLNDHVIKIYLDFMNLEEYPDSNVYSFNTFLLERMKTGGYDVVRKWTEETKNRNGVDIFKKRAILFPLNIKSHHWALMVYFVDEISLTLVDSLYSDADPNAAATIFSRWKDSVRTVKNYLVNERMKNYKDIDNFKSRLDKVTVTEVVRQRNGYDCGWHLLSFAELVYYNESINSIKTFEELSQAVTPKTIGRTKRSMKNLIRKLKNRELSQPSVVV